MGTREQLDILWLSEIKLDNSKESRRQPSQARSKKRVDAILKASKQLISEKGSAKLKIHDIAERAEVTPASFRCGQISCENLPLG